MQNFQGLQNLLNGGMNQGNRNPNARMADSSDKIIISSLALLKMLKHGRAGVPMEVMGLMLGSFVDEYTTIVVDVFAMPQSGTGVSVEAVDPVFQTNMLEMLKQTDRSENVVGWYHSHPGFGCWLSGVDVNTQQAFEKLDERNIAVVVDPIQSVKGKVVIDAFRLIDPTLAMMDEEFQQDTSNIGQLNPPSPQALYHGLNKHYYSLVIDYNKNENDQNMLLNLYKKKWNEGLKNMTSSEIKKSNQENLSEIKRLSNIYKNWIKTENEQTIKEFNVSSVGKLDPKRHLKQMADELQERCVLQNFGMMMNSKLF
jgi:26S proteasome regulatory subunit N11